MRSVACFLALTSRLFNLTKLLLCKQPSILCHFNDGIPAPIISPLPWLHKKSSLASDGESPVWSYSSLRLQSDRHDPQRTVLPKSAPTDRINHLEGHLFHNASSTPIHMPSPARSFPGEIADYVAEDVFRLSQRMMQFSEFSNSDKMAYLTG